MLLGAKSLMLCATLSEAGLPFCVSHFCRMRKEREKDKKGKEQESPGKPRRLHWSMSHPGVH